MSSEPNLAAPVALAGVEVLPERSRRPALVRPAESPPAATTPDLTAATAQMAAVHQRQENLAAHLTQKAQQLQNQSRINTQVLAVIVALTRVLAVRFLLFLSLCGAFVLAIEAMQRETIPALAVLVAYALLTLGPLVALEIRHGRTVQPPQGGA